MIINLVRDSSVASAPAGFMQAVQNAANAIAAVLTNNITVNIAVGWGEDNGTAVDPYFASGKPSAGFLLAYSTVATALANSSTSTADAVAGMSLLATTQNPNGTGFILV